MGFDFNNYESFGKKIGANTVAPPQEEHFRNSISRGYYSFYHKVKIHFGYTDGQKINHAELASKLLNDDSLKYAERLSNLMFSMIDDRVDADYFRTPRKGKVFNKYFYDRFWGTYNWCVNALKEKKD